MIASNQHDASSLPPVLSPCDNVRRSCRYIMSEPCVQEGGKRTVAIDSSALQELARSIHAKISSCTWAEWDTEGWHYTGNNYKGPNDVRQERVALYVLSLDAINFCFWPSTSTSENNTLEYDHLATALTRLAEQDDDSEDNDSYVFSPLNLANMTETQLVELLYQYLDKKHEIPNAAERVRLWNELGQGLLTHYQGTAMSLIHQASDNAPRLVNLLISSFPGFRDESLYAGKWVCFYKRAQIAVGDLQAALSLPLEQTDKLTMFADYRLPQLLRHVGVLQYEAELACTVDSQQEIPANSDEEMFIRAATVVAVEDLVQQVKALCNDNDSVLQSKITDVAMDWHLWQVGEELNSQSQMKPHHRTRTIFY